ncbi:MAG: 3'-5' exonuclease, partial [Bacteroidota bacterium]
MLSKLVLDNVLFLDIETVPELPDFNSLDEEKKQLWEQKSRYQRKDEITAEDFYDRAGIWAEFGKIIVISVGYFVLKGETRNFRVTSFHGNESELLLAFKNLLDQHFNKPQLLLCAHNGKE